MLLTPTQFESGLWKEVCITWSYFLENHSHIAFHWFGKPYVERGSSC